MATNTHRRRRRFMAPLWCLGRAFGTALLLAAVVVAPAQEVPSYGSEIAPLFSKNCVGCHSQTTKMGGLILETFDDLQKGGTHGKAVIAGESEESRLYQMLTGKLAPQMPFSAAPLSREEIATVKLWIDGGAPGPKPGEGIAKFESEELPVIEPSVPVKPQIFSLAYHPAGKMIALGRYRQVLLVDAATGKTVATLDGLRDVARGVAFSKDGRLLAAAGGLPQRGGEAKIWDVDTRRELRTIEGHGDTMQAVAFSPDGTILATSSYDKTLKLWEVASGRELRTLEDHIDAVYALEFTPDGKWLLSGSADRSVKIWDPASGQRLYTLSEPLEGINSIALHPSGKKVAAGGYDRTIRVWELGEDEGRLLNVLIAHQAQILRIAYSPDGETLVTASADKTIKVFDAETLEEITTIAGQPDWVTSLEFAPDSSRFAAGRFDGSLSVYDAASFQDRFKVLRAARSSP